MKNETNVKDASHTFCLCRVQGHGDVEYQYPQKWRLLISQRVDARARRRQFLTGSDGLGLWWRLLQWHIVVGRVRWQMASSNSTGRTLPFAIWEFFKVVSRWSTNIRRAVLVTSNAWKELKSVYTAFSGSNHIVQLRNYYFISTVRCWRSRPCRGEKNGQLFPFKKCGIKLAFSDKFQHFAMFFNIFKFFSEIVRTPSKSSTDTGSDGSGELQAVELRLWRSTTFPHWQQSSDTFLFLLCNLYVWYTPHDCSFLPWRGFSKAFNERWKDYSPGNAKLEKGTGAWQR